MSEPNAYGVAIGINYANDPEKTLNGCINDALFWAEYMDKHTFKSVLYLHEDEATKANMKKMLVDEIKKVPPGDLFVLTYSGHGTIVPPGTQAWVPYDFSWEDPDTWFTYDELDLILMRYEQQGVRVVIVSDSCHSAADPRKHLRTRSLHPTKFRYLDPPARIMTRTRGYPFGRNMCTADQNDIMLAGCRKEQTSADAFFEGHYWGAFTYALRRELTKDATLTYQAATLKARAWLSAQMFDQTPQACGDIVALSYPFFS